jgi:outer membrane protein
MKINNTTRKTFFSVGLALSIVLLADLGLADSEATEESGFELPKITPGPTMTMREILEAVDTRNLTLKSARTEIEKTEAQLSQSYALILPGAEASMQFMHRDHDDAANLGGMEIVIMPQQDLKGTLGIGMTLINAQSWATISVAKKGVALARMSVKDARRQLLVATSQAYLMSLIAKEVIDLKEDSVHATEHHLEVARLRFEAGAGLKIDILRAQTDLEKERQTLLSAHLAFDNSRDALRMLAQTNELPMPSTVREMTPPDGSDKQLVSQAIADRPDLKARQSAINLAKAQLDASLLQFVPTLDAGWQFQYQFTEMAEMGSSDRSRWAAVLTLTVPLYNHYRYGDIDYKRSSLRQAMINLEDTRENISMEVRKARRDYLTALSSSQIAKRQMALAHETLNLVEASYNAGTGSSLEVTDAREMVSQADMNLAYKRLEAQIQLLNLLSALGEDIIELTK